MIISQNFIGREHNKKFSVHTISTFVFVVIVMPTRGRYLKTVKPTH